MKNRKPFVMDKEMLELTDEVREIILREEKRYNKAIKNIENIESI